jgi:hypothetical protein
MLYTPRYGRLYIACYKYHTVFARFSPPLRLLLMIQAPLCVPLSSGNIEYKGLSGPSERSYITSHSGGHADILPSETFGLYMRSDILMMNHFYCCISPLAIVARTYEISGKLRAGRAIAQAVSRWLPTWVVRVRAGM